jgi:hypothetical protein
MKVKLTAILLVILAILWPLPSRSQQPAQHILYYGYFGATTDTDLSRVRSYTNFTYIDGEYGVSIAPTLTRIHNYGLRAIIDLGKVLWCPAQVFPGTCPGYSGWHLCGTQGGTEASYITRWNDWVSANSSVLNSSYVLSFSVITESQLLGIPNSDVERAVALVKQTFPTIPTLVAEASISITDSYVVPANADWVGIADYYTHPNLDDNFKAARDRLINKKSWWQKTAYTMDAFHGPSHVPVAPTPADMDTIAQEWFTIVSEDSDAVVLAPFIWADLTCEGAIGSTSFPQNVLDKHAAIGAAIFAGRMPSYAGSYESLDCNTVAGWAWDSSQPNTPISVDVYDGSTKLTTVRANQFRQDLFNAGLGNGQHGFTFSLPSSVRNGVSHAITVKYGGLLQSLGTRWITCNNYEGYVDVADCNSIIGWAADRYRLNTSITVSIYDGWNFVTTIWANGYRGDVGSYLGDNGYHGFGIATPPQFKDGAAHTLRVRFESGSTELGWSPRTIQCAAPYYEIVARHSGKCIDIEGESTASGARAIQFGCGGWPNQQFQIIPVGSGYYKIVARHSGKVLDVQWGALDNGTPIWQWDENGSAAQQWQIIDVGGGYVKIIARHSGKAMDVAGGSTADLTQIHQWDYVGIANQQWLLRQVP